MPQTLDLDINGTPHRIETEPSRSLLSVLRDDLDLTGTKYGCGEGQCRACTVLVEGRPTRSCVTPVGTLTGRRITTIEGLETGGRLHPVQEAFLKMDALQCGYCTPGMILACVALLQKASRPSPSEIIEALEGNLCRCGTYPRIVKAVHAVSKGSSR